jgi:hypothetical protein
MTTHSTCALALAAAGLALTAPHPAHAKGAPLLTSDQAIAIARTYCAAVGQPQTGPATTLFPSTEHDPAYSPLYYLPRWRVSFQNDTNTTLLA